VGPRLSLSTWISFAAALALAGGCGSSASIGDRDAAGGDGAAADGGTGSFRLTCAGASGTRLRQVVRKHGDGSAEFLRLHDTDFAESCSFAPASDGVLRCLPAVDGFPFADGAIRYIDLACSLPIGQLNGLAAVPPPGYMREIVPPAAACAAPTASFHVLGTKLAIPPDTVIYQKAGDACTAVAAPATDFFEVTADMPPDRFVEGSESETDSGRLAIAQVDGADGSRFCQVQGALRDRGLGNHACFLGVSEDGSVRCLPDDVARSGAFSDALCTVPIEVALVDQQCNPDATYLADPAGVACSLRQTVRMVGSELPPPVYVAGATCAETAPGQVAHAIGASVSPFSLAEVTRSFAPSDGDRLERGDLVSGDGLRLFPFEAAFRLTVWRDGALDRPCAFALAADGATRCLPIDSPFEATARLTVRYTDAACTVPVPVGGRDASCAAGEPSTVLEALAGGLTRVYAAGAAHPGPLYELGKACAEVPAGALFYQLGPELLPQTFVGGIEMLE